MSGVFGLVTPPIADQLEHQSLMQTMGRVLRHRLWHQIETSWDNQAGAGLGRVGIGVFNRQSQPVASEDGSVRLVLAGELRDPTALRRNLERTGSCLRDTSDAELALRLYERYGIDFVTRLEGAFVIAIWDRNTRTAYLCNDRFGRYPTFYTRSDRGLIFAPELKALLCVPYVRRELDMDALAEYMRFQRLLGEKTFFVGLSLLPHASILSYDQRAGALTIRPYWSFGEITSVRAHLEEAVEEGRRLLRESVRESVSGPYRVSVYLSGGKDSRLIAGLAVRYGGSIHTATFGAPDCRDVYYAARIARKLGTIHHYFPYRNGHWVLEHVDDHMELTEGLHSWVHLHGIDTLRPMREHADLQLTGFCGDHLFQDLSRNVEREGADNMRRWSRQTFVSKLYGIYCQRLSWPGLEEGEAARLFATPIRATMQGRAFDSLERAAQPFLEYDPLKGYDYFKYVNHTLRLIHNYVTFYRSSLEVRYPFLTYAIFDFACGLDPKVRYSATNRLYSCIISRELPELALIASDKQERLVTENRLLYSAHALARRAKSGVNRFIAPLFPRRATLYADYEEYLRNDLRAWGEQILFDERTVDRGIFDPDTVRALWNRHMDGNEVHTIGKIAPLISYELMLRRLYDPAPTPEALAATPQETV